MTDAMRKRFAEFEGIPHTVEYTPMVFGPPSKERRTRARLMSEYPIYDTHDSIQRLIDRMDYNTLYKYHSHLVSMFEASAGQYAYVKMLRCSVIQKQAALIAAMGWREE